MDEYAAEVRGIDDVRALRALTHPVRLALLEVLFVDGPLTATEAGKLIGESPTTCSFHLRQLAKYGFVEENGGGQGRSRPWRVTARGMRVQEGDGTSEVQSAASALSRLLRERFLRRFQEWNEDKTSYPESWRNAAIMGEHVIWLTPAELVSLNADLSDRLAALYPERRQDPRGRPADALPVELLVFAYPTRLSSKSET